LKLRQGSLGLNGVNVNGLCHKRVEATIMAKLNTKEDVALLVAEASEMFEETGYVPIRPYRP
jgi:hypothetical protein